MEPYVSDDDFNWSFAELEERRDSAIRSASRFAIFQRAWRIRRDSQLHES